MHPLCVHVRLSSGWWQGQPPILSRYKAPADHASWSPNSVLSVKTQSWADNYADKNIADNPIIPTIADLLIGPDR
jgi:hypothetical protein